MRGSHYVVVAALLFSAFGPDSRGEEPNSGKKPDEKEAKPTLTVSNEKGKTTTFTAEAIAKLPRQTMKTTDRSGTQATYEGTSLAEVLRAAGVTLGKELKGPLLTNCVVVQATDNYKVVFSLPELDAASTDQVVLLADRKDGKALDDKEGPYRLVVPHDKRPMRWVRQVTRISIQGVTEPAPEKK